MSNSPENVEAPPAVHRMVSLRQAFDLMATLNALRERGLTGVRMTYKGEDFLRDESVQDVSVCHGDDRWEPVTLNTIRPDYDECEVWRSELEQAWPALVAIGDTWNDAAEKEYHSDSASIEHSITLNATGEWAHVIRNAEAIYIDEKATVQKIPTTPLSVPNDIAWLLKDAPGLQVTIQVSRTQDTIFAGSEGAVREKHLSAVVEHARTALKTLIPGANEATHGEHWSVVFNARVDATGARQWAITEVTHGAITKSHERIVMLGANPNDKLDAAPHKLMIQGGIAGALVEFMENRDAEGDLYQLSLKEMNDWYQVFRPVNEITTQNTLEHA